jgi:hypothetical protein
MRKALAFTSVLLLALLWTNSRIVLIRRNQDPARPTVLSAYYVYHGMAAALESGRLGQIDLTRYRAYQALGNPQATYPPRSEVPQFVPYYSLDVGYSFLVEFGRLAFPSLPDNHLRALALQLIADAALVVFVYWAFSAWRAWLGVAAALLYVENRVLRELGSFAFYYYWDVPLTFACLGFLLVAAVRPHQARGWLGLAGACLGFGVWLRASWWPLALFFFAIVWTSRTLRRAATPALVTFCVLAAPQVLRSSLARGYPALSTRAVWHVALVGLGYYPNPYGLQPHDESVFRLVRAKYGITFRMEDYGPHDLAAKQEYLSILRKDPAFVVRSFLGRLGESLLGTTKDSMSPYAGISAPIYRALCLAGLLLMIGRGGDRRLLGLVAAGVYLIYVGLTSVFYYVGLAYDNVSEVALLFLIVGLLDSALHLAGGPLRRAVRSLRMR